VVKAVVLVDRQELNGRENILAEVPELEALATRDELMERFRQRRKP
jgi:orotate phosphoribosyltransferase